MKQHTLPNGMDIFVQTPTEADFFYDDIFADRVYLHHGITLPPEAVVFDVGANIGMFSLFAHYHGLNPTIYAFEPAPPLFGVLKANVQSHSVKSILYNEGLSDSVGEATLTFYPRSSGMSSFHGDLDEEKGILRRIMENQTSRGMNGMETVMKHQEELLEHRFESESYTCPLRPLSHVIREHRIDRIDLLKIDVQKAEAQVLAGIAERDWPKILQIVLEVHDDEGRLREMTTDLRERGFKVATEQESLYEKTNIHNVYARREGSVRSAEASRLQRRISRRTRR